MIRIWLSEEQAKSVLCLVSQYIAKFEKLTGDSVPKQKWQQILLVLLITIYES